MNNYRTDFQDGYRATILQAENCLPGAPIFQPIGGTVNVSDTCDVTSNACSIIQPYSTFKIELKAFDAVTNLPVQIEGRDHLAMDMCAGDVVIPDMMKLAMVAYGIPPICPVTQPTRHCYDQSSLFTIGKDMRELMPLYAVKGAFKIVMTTQHDTGSSCISITLSFVK